MSTTCSTTTTAVSKSPDNQADIEAIASVIQAYAEGGRKGDAAIMKLAFREDATIHGRMNCESRPASAVVCRERLGGLLRSYTGVAA